MYEDKSITCANCGREFVWTASEQEFYASKGLANPPKRCPDCRKLRKDDVRKSRGNREMFTTVCSNCGGEARVPFKPSNDKPVLCDTCFKASRA